MSRLKNVGSAAIAVSLFALGLSPIANAQWLPDRNYTEGPGIRVGDLELHPGVAVRGGYDTNVFRTDSRRVGSAILAVTPHLNLTTLGGQRAAAGEDAAGARSSASLPPVAFKLGASGTFFKYFEKSAPTNVEFDTDANLSVLPGRRFGFDLGAAYSRSIRPFGAAGGFTANNLFAIDQVRPVVKLRAQSGSGVLSGTLSYAPNFQIYENSTYSYLSSRAQEVSGSAAWKFIPYTALVYDGAVSFIDYYNRDNSNAVLLLSNNTRFQSRLGVNGAISEHFGARLLAGYAVGAYKNRQFNDFENVIGEAALNYRIDSNLFEIGYQRTVTPSTLGGWMQQDRGYLSAETLLGRVVALKLSGGIGRANYGRMLARDGTPLGVDAKTGRATDKREDLRGDAGFHAEYRATNWLAFMADLSVLATKTDFRYISGGPFAAQFVAFQAFGGVRAHY